MKKKLMVLLLTLCCLFGVLGFAACDMTVTVTRESGSSSSNSSNDDGASESESSTEEEEREEPEVPSYSSEGLLYELSEDKTYYLVKGLGTATDTDVIIASRYNRLPVKEIQSSAFKNCTALTSITVPNSVTTIGKGAFSGCSSLTSITLPFIGQSASAKGSSALFGYIFGANSFSGGTGTRQYIYILKSDTGSSSSYTTYYIPTSLKIVTLTDNVIPSFSFSNCKNLEHVYIGQNVSYIGYEPFYECTSLNYNNKDDATYLGDETNPYRALIKVQENKNTIYTIEDTVGLVASSAFSALNSLQKIQIDAGNKAYNTNGSCLIRTADKRLVLGVNNFVIPEDVTKIEAYAFRGRSSPTEITISEAITQIGEFAFKDCENINKVNYKGTIDGWAQISFGNESANPLISATQFHIQGEAPTNIEFTTTTTINAFAFYGCDSLISIQAMGNVKSIGEKAFYSCDGLTEVVISDNVETIGERAFDYCSALRELTIGAGVKRIDWDAFSNCRGLQKINYNIVSYEEYYWSTTDGGNNIFDNSGNDDGITVTIGASVKGIPSRFFQDAHSVSKVIFEEGSVCEAIGEDAFYCCTLLTEIIIPASVKEIIGGGDVFYGCNLEKIEVESGNQKYRSYENCLIEIETGTLLLGCKNSIIPDDGSIKSIGDGAFSAFENCEELTQIDIPDGVTTIERHAFMDCIGLTSISIPDSVTFIGSAAFQGCTGIIQEENGVSYVNGWVIGCSTLVESVSLREGTRGIAEYGFDSCDSLTSVIIPNSVIHISSYAFTSCKNLTNVTFEQDSQLRSIPNYAFSNCNQLTSITVPASVMSIGQFAFGGSLLRPSSMEDIFVEESNSVYKDIDGNLYSKDGTVLFLYAAGKTATEFTIPDGVTTVEAYAFYHCSSLTSVTIPNSVRYIKENAFYYCIDVISVTFMENSRLETIENNAFTVCEGLTSITIPDSVTFIGDYAFATCGSLENVFVEEGNSTYKDIDGNLYSKDGTVLFYYATGKTALEFVVPDGVTEIRAYAFYNCSSLKKVILPDGVTTIGECAFAESSWESIVIPNSVATIEKYAFNYGSIGNVYYGGTAAEWNAISIDAEKLTISALGVTVTVVSNSNLTSAPRYYYSETAPTSGGNCWHYVDGVPTAW